MIYFICGIYKIKQNETQAIDTENGFGGCRRWGWEERRGVRGAKWIKEVKRYQLAILVK